ncbi:MAG: phosphotransferase [Elusimicrobiota bacterium]
MKKIDLHIHTISTSSDAAFLFDLDRLKEYVNNAHLDAIAVTNHNTFDIDQFRDIKDSVGIPVFPGIEISLENGHLLLIADGKELSDFNSRCMKLADRIVTEHKSITVSELIEIFQDLAKYILIPHYDKIPIINEKVLAQLNAYITTGEVASPKKFMYCLKDDKSLVPVYFSDCRIKPEFTEYPSRQTYVNCGEITFEAIKCCLRDKNKVSLSPQEGHSSFQVFDDGQELSTGLNVIVGERSSGKTFTLERINKISENIKYIKQFELVERNDEKDEKEFSKILSNSHSLVTQEYLREFQLVVNDIVDIDIEENNRAVSNFLQSLVKHAKESERQDAFSHAILFAEEMFQNSDLKGLEELIESVIHLIENVEYKAIIEKHVSVQVLKSLIMELIHEYEKKDEEIRKKQFLNDLISEIKKSLQRRSAATKIDDVDLYQIVLEKDKVTRFANIAKIVRRDHKIVDKNLQGFKIVAKANEFTGASELRSLSKSNKSFSSAYQTYQDPYGYLQKLKEIDGLAKSEYYLYFTRIQYHIDNKDGFEVSGGERSEFNLLQAISDAQRFDMLLIDEPESSFDNLFLKNEVNNIIKEISKTMPVVLVTHNSTVGASIKPDYILYTKKEVIKDKVEYRIYSGFPNDKELVARDGKKINNLDVTLNCLEAGKQAYDERGRIYANLENS